MPGRRVSGSSGRRGLLLCLRCWLQPLRKSAAVVPDLRRYAEVGAQESRSQLGYQLLAGVPRVSETLPSEIPVKPLLVVRPVR